MRVRLKNWMKVYDADGICRVQLRGGLEGEVESPRDSDDSYRGQWVAFDTVPGVKVLVPDVELEKV